MGRLSKIGESKFKGVLAVRSIKCKACGLKVAANTRVCPHCGARVLHPFAAATAAVLCIFFVLIVIYMSSDDTKYRPMQANVKDIDDQSHVETPACIESSPPEVSGIVLGPGTYTVGQDIDAGTYDCVAVSGLGVIRGDIKAYGDHGFIQTMGSASATIDDATVSIESVSTYSNLTLETGDVFYIEMSLSVEFIPS